MASVLSRNIYHYLRIYIDQISTFSLIFCYEIKYPHIFCDTDKIKSRMSYPVFTFFLLAKIVRKLLNLSICIAQSFHLTKLITLLICFCNWKNIFFICQVPNDELILLLCLHNLIKIKFLWTYSLLYLLKSYAL